MLGKSGICKTTRLRDLEPSTTLFIDIEAGDLSVASWPGDTIRSASWPECHDLFVYLAGPDRLLPPEAAFSVAHYDHVVGQFGAPAQIDRYATFFVDSITQMSRFCFTWCKAATGGHQARSLRPAPDLRAAYGCSAEMVGAPTHPQHARGKNVEVVAILDERLDDFNRRVSSRRSKAARPGCRCQDRR